MAVDRPISRVSRSEGGKRVNTVSKHSRNLNDIRVTSQKQTLQHTVRAKKLDERQLYKFMKALDDSKSRRLLQIDKEVAEIEKLMRRLTAEQEDAEREAEQRGMMNGDATTYRRRRGNKKQKTTKMSKEFDEYAFRARQQRGSIGRKGKDKADKVLNSYYRFDSGGNRKVFSPLISSPSKTPNPPTRVAWDKDFFPEDISLSNYTVATETDSRIDSATNKSFTNFNDNEGDEVFAQTPSDSVFMTSGKFSSQSAPMTPISQAHSAPSKGSKTVKVRLPKGVGNVVSSQTPTKQIAEGKTGKVDDREDKLSRRSDSRSSVPVVRVTDDDGIELNFKRSRLTLKRRPKVLAAENKDDYDQLDTTDQTDTEEDLQQRATNVNECTGRSCPIADCIFHRPASLRRHSSTIQDPRAAYNEYYRVASASHSRATGQPFISPVFQTPDDSSWSQARRVPVSPPSPTPSEILSGVVLEREVVAEKPDYTDLDVMLSVRRPVKGSNRDRMLKDKEDNIKNTFKIMRQKMAANVPPDFNTNYGTPTPNWKILDPLKMRHKIAHSSPLFTLWKLN